MKQVTVIEFHTHVAPRHIQAILSLTEGQHVLHHHDQAVFTTPFHPWFTQLKSRTNRRHLRTSRFRAAPDGRLFDGKELPEKQFNPKGFYTVRWPAGVKADV